MAFLLLNGLTLTASDADLVLTIERLADRSLSEADFDAWIPERLRRRRCQAFGTPGDAMSRCSTGLHRSILLAATGAGVNVQFMTDE